MFEAGWRIELTMREMESELLQQQPRGLVLRMMSGEQGAGPELSECVLEDGAGSLGGIPAAPMS